MQTTSTHRQTNGMSASRTNGGWLPCGTFEPMPKPVAPIAATRISFHFIKSVRAFWDSMISSLSLSIILRPPPSIRTALGVSVDGRPHGFQGQDEIRLRPLERHVRVRHVPTAPQIVELRAAP